MVDNDDMFVSKRNGKLEQVAFDKILQRIKKVGMEADIKINYTALAMKVIDQLYDKISTTKIDELTAEQCASMSSTHPDYNALAGRITISNHHKNTESSFTKVMTQLYQFKDVHGVNQPLVSKQLYQSMSMIGYKKLNGLCDYTRDYLIDYFGFKTLERAYLMKLDRKIVERPQHMWLRVALGIHGTNWEKIVETYEHMSQKYFTHATPTLFNAGTPNPQLSSCYLMSMEDDSIDGIFNTLKDCALISKWAGGIGLHIHNVRATGTHINGTNGTSNGIVPMLKVFNNTAKYVDQCVLPTTWVYTTDGPVEIQDIIANKTKLINETGKTEVVQNVLEHTYEGKLLSIDSEFSYIPLEITPEHPVLAVPATAISYDGSPIVPEYIDAKDLRENDYIAMAIPKHVVDDSSLSNEICYFYGLMLFGGYMYNFEMAGRYENRKSCFLVLDREYHTKEIPVCLEFLTQHHIAFTQEKIEKCGRPLLKLDWNQCVDFPIRYSDMFYRGEKRIQSRWLNLPVKKQYHILKGIFDINKTGFVDEPMSLNVYNILHPSFIVMEAVRYLLLRSKSVTKYYYLEQSDIYHLTAVLDPKLVKFMKIKCEEFIPIISDNKYIFDKILSTEERDYSGTLYDLQMKDVHNYMVHNGVIHNGGGKRNGSFAIYLEPWHADVEMFLQMRKNHGDEELKARDLFYALWIPDLFMERVKSNGQWTLMCPHECPGLSDVYGDKFKTLYEKYETDGRGKRTVNARDLWFQILDAQMETGTPYLLYKDAANRKSNQKNLGTIKSSNLCVAPETLVLTDDGHYPIYSLWAGNYPENQQESHKMVNIWNGTEFSEVEVMKTGEDQELVEVFTSDGVSLVCTPYHKFFIRENEDIYIKEARDLNPEDELQECPAFPCTDKGESIERMKAIDLGIEVGMMSLRLTDETVLTSNIFVPMYYNLQTKLDWLAGFLEPYVCDLRIDKESHIYIPCKSLIFLQDLKWMLQTCGINTYIQCVEEDTKNLVIAVIQIKRLMQFGLAFYHDYFKEKEISAAEMASEIMNPIIKITRVEQLTRREDTYCFVEPLQHAGVFNGIRTSQCTEIIEYSDKDETAVCNLASIALPAFVEPSDEGEVTFNYEKLHEVTKIVTGNLNRIIDVNYYPTPKTRVSNMRHRPIGIGVQGLADVFLRMGFTFTEAKSKQMNRDIFETIYHASLERSCEIAQEEGAYETFKGSPASEGILQFDMWEVDPGSTRYDWSDMKTQIKTHGLRNSLLLAPMPTASTSQILGYNECIEPITSNIYTRRTIAGEFIMVNRYLMKELLDLGMWNETLKNHMVANNGSIQDLEYIPQEVRDKYKTVWEIPMRDLIDMSADRGVFICQSQSLNLWMEDPNYNTMTSMHFYSWSKGLKTGIYYLRRRPRHQAQQFTIEPEKRKALEEEEGGCEMCSA